MAASGNIIRQLDLGNIFACIVDVTGDAAYPAGGYTGITALSGLGVVLGVDQIGNNTGAAGYTMVLNTQTNKLQIFITPGFTPAGTVSAPTITMAGSGGGGAVTVNPEATGGALVHNAAGTITGITGVQAPTFTGNAVASASLVEVSGNIATLVFRLLVFGT